MPTFSLSVADNGELRIEWDGKERLMSLSCCPYILVYRSDDWVAIPVIDDFVSGDNIAGVFHGTDQL